MSETASARVSASMLLNEYTKFYDDPANEAAFRAWKAEQSAKTKAAPAETAAEAIERLSVKHHRYR